MCEGFQKSPCFFQAVKSVEIAGPQERPFPPTPSSAKESCSKTKPCLWLTRNRWNHLLLTNSKPNSPLPGALLGGNAEKSDSKLGWEIRQDRGEDTASLSVMILLPSCFSESVNNRVPFFPVQQALCVSPPLREATKPVSAERQLNASCCPFFHQMHPLPKGGNT